MSTPLRIIPDFTSPNLGSSGAQIAADLLFTVSQHQLASRVRTASLIKQSPAELVSSRSRNGAELAVVRATWGEASGEATNFLWAWVASRQLGANTYTYSLSRHTHTHIHIIYTHTYPG